MIAAIIQARMGSSRLPGKTLMPIEGRPMLGHLVDRLRACDPIDQIVIATTTEKHDEAIARFAEQNGLSFYRGSERDVLDRFYQTALTIQSEHIVRVTPDCPMLDPSVTKRVIREYLAGDWDYASNAIEPSYPDGLDSEIFSFPTLARTWREARLPSEREHVTAYMVKHPETFRLLNVTNPHVDLSAMRWTVDTAADLEFAQHVFAHLYPHDPLFGMQDVLRLLERKPELSSVNRDIPRNEGYKRSLENDR